MTAVRPAQVWTQGEVESIDLANRTLMVAHQPIPEWQWPAMEMEFTVADGSTSASWPRADPASASDAGGDEYRITTIHQEQAPATGDDAKPATDEMGRWKAWTIASTDGDARMEKKS